MGGAGLHPLLGSDRNQTWLGLRGRLILQVGSSRDHRQPGVWGFWRVRGFGWGRAKKKYCSRDEILQIHIQRAGECCGDKKMSPECCVLVAGVKREFEERRGGI